MKKLMCLCFFVMACYAHHTQRVNTYQGTATSESSSYFGGIVQISDLEVNPEICRDTPNGRVCERADVQMVETCMSWLNTQQQAWQQLPEDGRPVWGCYLGQLSIPAQCINLQMFRQPLPIYQCGGGMGMMGGVYQRLGMLPR